jgi:hypothetical protein
MKHVLFLLALAGCNSAPKSFVATCTAAAPSAESQTLPGADGHGGAILPAAAA